MIPYAIMAWIGAGLALALGLSVFLRRKSTVVQWSFLAGMTLLGLETLFAGLAYQALLPHEIVHWETARLLVMSFVPGTWLFFTLAYSRGNSQRSVR